ncbi:hypothetical protein OG585_42980 [Streptomyces sp. NBC_01340]|nr:MULTISPECIES: hypothetical protein [unclassified Streptomyces]MCX4459499.1 hypothetical protein [Streptomyces sp. NBC_01719]MCX4498857.1 hypothetical protein [Streptomyces sp. NBC_01728]MCX4595238.1 hypothetical protein [Streptomyces sp. NBC_01549]WSI43316.1 hypothetical protein OG585_42980 [Streptomyces sp. NBC_01340]
MEPTSAPLREELAAALARSDVDFRLKPRVAPFRQGRAGVLAYPLTRG